MNVHLSSRHTVHATREGASGPACYAFGAPHGNEAYRPTTRRVTCKKCLKVQEEAAEQVAVVTPEVVEIIENIPAEVLDGGRSARTVPTMTITWTTTDGAKVGVVEVTCHEEAETRISIYRRRGLRAVKNFA